MLRPDLFESVDLKNAVSQMMCMSRKSDLEYYETDPIERAQVPDAKAIDSLLMRRQHVFRPPPSESEYQRKAAAAAMAGVKSDRRQLQPSAGRSRYLLVNASNALVSSFNHISMREGQLSKGKYVTLTFHVRQPNWFDQLKQVYVNAKSELDKLIAFMRRLRCEEGSTQDIDFQDFVKAERDLIYSERNLRQWAYKFDVELRRDSLMRHAIEAFQCRLGLDGCDNLGYSFGLFLDECLCTNETAPRQVINDSTPANYKIMDRADIFVTNYFAMTANRAFREEVVSVLYEVYVRDSKQPQQQQEQQQEQQQQQQQQQPNPRSYEFGHVWGQQPLQAPQPQQMFSSEFTPSRANTLTHYEKPPPQQPQHQRGAGASVAAASATAAAGAAQNRSRLTASSAPGGSVVRIQVPNSRKAAASAATGAVTATAASLIDGDDSSIASIPAARSARSQLMYVGNS